MAEILPVLQHPHPILRATSSKIEASFLQSEEFKSLSKDMIKTMHSDDGIGLAAPQIGKSIRMITIGKEAFAHEESLPFSKIEDLVLINPEFATYSWKTALDEEGCLSVPGLVGDVERHVQVSASATLSGGERVEFVATDYFARVLQHEVDHLNGILFIDRAKQTSKKVRPRTD